MTSSRSTSVAPPAAGPLGDSAELVDLLQKQKVLYGSLDRLSQEQAGIVARGQTEQLLAVLGRRQQLLDTLGQLNEKMTPYRNRWAEVWAGLAPAQQEVVGGLVKACQELLARIIAQDETDRQQLQQAKARMATEIQKMHQGGAAISAYRNRAAPAAPRFTNRQG